MLRIWGKIMNGGQMLNDYVAESDNRNLSLSDRLDACMDEMSRFFDLPKPIWLDRNYDELNRFGRTSFRQDHFIEPINFRQLDIEILEMED